MCLFVLKYGRSFSVVIVLSDCCVCCPEFLESFNILLSYSPCGCLLLTAVLVVRSVLVNAMLDVTLVVILCW